MKRKHLKLSLTLIVFSVAFAFGFTLTPQNSSNCGLVSKSLATHEIELYSQQLHTLFPKKDLRCQVPISWVLSTDCLQAFQNYPKVRVYLGLEDESSLEPLLVIVGVDENGDDDNNGPVANLIHPCPTLCEGQNDNSDFKKAFCNAIDEGDRCDFCNGVN